MNTLTRKEILMAFANEQIVQQRCPIGWQIVNLYDYATDEL